MENAIKTIKNLVDSEEFIANTTMDMLVNCGKLKMVGKLNNIGEGTEISFNHGIKFNLKGFIPMTDPVKTGDYTFTQKLARVVEDCFCDPDFMNRYSTKETRYDEATTSVVVTEEAVDDTQEIEVQSVVDNDFSYLAEESDKQDDEQNQTDENNGWQKPKKKINNHVRYVFFYILTVNTKDGVINMNMTPEFIKMDHPWFRRKFVSENGDANFYYPKVNKKYIRKEVINNERYSLVPCNPYYVMHKKFVDKQTKEIRKIQFRKFFFLVDPDGSINRTKYFVNKKTVNVAEGNKETFTWEIEMFERDPK